jgi:hypothetical protein
LNLIVSDYDLNCGIVADEVVNYNKINAHLYQTVRNLVGEFSDSDSYTNEGSADSRLTDESSEVEIPLNEKFNDYIGNDIYSGSGNHVEGTLNKLWGDFSTLNNHVEGNNNFLVSGGNFQFGSVYKSEEQVTAANYLVDYIQTANSHIEGNYNKNFFSKDSHIEGTYNTATIGKGQHVEGMSGTAYGDYSHVEGFHGLPNNSVSYNINLTGNLGTDVPNLFQSIDRVRIQENSLNNPNFDVLPTPDYLTLLVSKSVDLTHAVANQFMRYTNSNQEGVQLIRQSKGIAFGKYSHIEGQNTSTFGTGSHAEGQNTSTIGDYSHAEGQTSHAFGKGSHVEGGYNIAGSFGILGENKTTNSNGTTSVGVDYTLADKASVAYSDIDDYHFMNLREVPSENNTSNLRFVFEDTSIGNSSIGAHNSEYQIKTGYQHNTARTAQEPQDYIDINSYSNRGMVSGLGFYGVLNYYSGVKGYQHAEGYKNIAFGDLTHVEGIRNWAVTPGTHIEGFNNFGGLSKNSSLTSALDVQQSDSTYNEWYGGHIEGASNTSVVKGAYHIEGFGNYLTDSSVGNHIEGSYNVLGNNTSTHIEGYHNSSNSGSGNHVEGHSYQMYSTQNTYNSRTGKWTYYSGQSKYIGTYGGSYIDAYSPSMSSVIYGTRSSYDNYIYKDVTGGGTTKTNYMYYRGNFAGNGSGNHSEGNGTFAMNGNGHHAEGSVAVVEIESTNSYDTQNGALNYYNRYYYHTYAGGGTANHAEGQGCSSANGNGLHAEGYLSFASQGDALHAEGYNNGVLNGNGSHAEGHSNYIYNGNGHHIEGFYNLITGGTANHIEGACANYNTETGNSLKTNIINNSTGTSSNSFGSEIINYTSLLSIMGGASAGVTTTVQAKLNSELGTTGYSSITDRYTNLLQLDTRISGQNRGYGTAVHIEGMGNNSDGGYANHLEGICNYTAYWAIAGHVEGILNKASLPSSHAEGLGTQTHGIAAHAEGIGGYSNNRASHTEGYHCECYAVAGHSEGYENLIAGNSQGSHVEGSNNIINNAPYAHCGGSTSRVTGNGGFAHGLGLTAGSNQVAFGKYNDTSAPNASNIMFMIGNGTGDSTRSNILELDKDGNLSISGDIVFNGNLTLTQVLEEIRNSGGGSGGGGSYRNGETTRY